MDQLTAAAEHYQKAIALRPDYAEAHLNLANLLKAQDKTADALARYRRALEVNPNMLGVEMNVRMLEEKLKAPPAPGRST